MKKKNSIISTLVGLIVSMIFLLMFLKYTGLYDPFINIIKYLPDFFRDIGNSWKAGVK